jgi:chromosome segregation ATPase
MERTLKLRAYSDGDKNKTPQSKQEKERNIALELEKKSLLLEEEKNKSLDLLKTIVQLRESLKQEQTKTADLDNKLTKLNSVEENQLARKNAQLEEEKSRSQEYTKTIEQLKEDIKQLESKLSKLNSVEENELAKKNSLLEEERAKSLEYVKLIDQLRENVKKEQAKSEEMVSKFDELLAKTKSSAELESQVKELKDVLGTISRIASSGKLDGNA